MKNTLIIDRLVKANREADMEFSAARKAGAHPVDFARIIGKLQGEIMIAVIEMGYRSPIKEKPCAILPVDRAGH